MTDLNLTISQKIKKKIFELLTCCQASLLSLTGYVCWSHEQGGRLLAMDFQT
jgi:hypothetical protein